MHFWGPVVDPIFARVGIYLFCFHSQSSNMTFSLHIEKWLASGFAVNILYSTRCTVFLFGVECDPCLWKWIQDFKWRKLWSPSDSWNCETVNVMVHVFGEWWRVLIWFSFFFFIINMSVLFCFYFNEAMKTFEICTLSFSIKKIFGPGIYYVCPENEQLCQAERIANVSATLALKSAGQLLSPLLFLFYCAPPPASQ